MEKFRIYIIEDDPWYGELIKHHLSMNSEYEVTLLESAKECLDQLVHAPDVICLDFGLPDMSGAALLQKIKKVNDSIPVVIISGQEDITVATDLLRSGAYDYIVKDDNTKELVWNTILKIRENWDLKKEVADLKDQLGRKYSFQETIIGQSQAIKKIFALIEKASRSNINVSISGETGTGKELVANAIHFNSSRKKKHFIAVNMAAIPEELIESELFGHEKGAFTGAIDSKAGKFEAAQGGTIFLDEIAELDLNLQSKLLRVLQEREVVRIGGNKRIPLDIRLITATNRDLAEAVKCGDFREDLYYRIIGLPIQLPPLRSRGKDILILAKHFTDHFAKDNQMGSFTLSEDAKEKLLRYNYPGNIRELKAIIDLACIMCDGNHIKGDDITYTSVKGDEHFVAIEKTLREYECDIISYFLDKYNNNVVLVAEKLGIGKSKIYNMLKQEEIKAKQL